MEPARHQLLLARQAATRRPSAGRADLVVLTLLALFALILVAVPAARLLGTGGARRRRPGAAARVAANGPPFADVEMADRRPGRGRRRPAGGGRRRAAAAL